MPKTPDGLPRKPSGYQFRKRGKEKKEAEEELLSKVPKLTTFFTSVTSVSSSSSDVASAGDDVGLHAEDEEDPEASNANESIKANIEGDQSESETQEEGQASASSGGQDVNNDNDDVVADELQTASGPSTFESLDLIDRAFYGNRVLSNEDKRFIVRNSPLQPKGPFPTRKFGNQNRGFREDYYTRITKSGITLPRTWLSYSQNSDMCYCVPCWLFSTSPNRMWSDGTSDWPHIRRGIPNHELSAAHTDACQIFNRWKNETTVDMLTEQEITENRKFWRRVLDRMINLIITLSCNNISFRGHREDDTAEEEGSQGNFLNFVKLLARYDSVLSDLLKKPRGTTKYLSPAIQNELIELLAETVKREIIAEIKSAPFVSVIMDTTQDISKVDQLSKIFRYVSIVRDEAGTPVSFEIEEAFLGFTAIQSQKAAHLASVIFKEIEEVTEISKIRGQGYDGAANMSGPYSGVQTRLKEKMPYARYSHCAGHALNLVINDAVSNVQELRNFFDMLEQLYVFFSAISRWSSLQQSESCNITLKRVCPTRWYSRNQALMALRSRYTDVMKLLTVLSLNGKNHKERTEATTLKKYYERFSTIVTVVFQSQVLGPMDVISKMLQSKTLDLSAATDLMDSLLQKLGELRKTWVATVASATELAGTWGIKPEFDTKRRAPIKKFFDELSRDSRLESGEKRYEVEVFNRGLDITIEQLKTRFDSLRQTNMLFHCIKPSSIEEMTVEKLLPLAKSLVQNYHDDLSHEFCDQLVLLKLSFSSALANMKSIKELLEFLLVEYSEVSSSFSEVITAAILFLTIPVTVASAERSFSKLKLIKSYLRSTMSQSRLSALAVLSIERNRVKKLDSDLLIDQFVENKVRKKNF